MSKRAQRLDDVAWLRARRAKGWSVTKLAAELAVDHRHVSAALRRAGLPVPFPVQHRYPELHDVVWLSEALAQHSMEDVARDAGLCTAIRSICGPEVRRPGHDQRTRPTVEDCRQACRPSMAHGTTRRGRHCPSAG